MAPRARTAYRFPGETHPRSDGHDPGGGLEGERPSKRPLHRGPGGSFGIFEGPFDSKTRPFDHGRGRHLESRNRPDPEAQRMNRLNHRGHREHREWPKSNDFNSVSSVTSVVKRIWL